MVTKQIFNARSQQIETAELTIDQNGEVVATFEDGGFLKFPANLNKTEFQEQVDTVQVANEGQVTIEASEKLLTELAGEDTNETQTDDSASAEDSQPAEELQTDTGDTAADEKPGEAPTA